MASTVCPRSQPAPYKVLTTAAGFADALQTNVVLTIGQNATLNVTLQPAGASESVTGHLGSRPD